MNKYVIMEAGIEYNDSTYDIGGERGKVLRQTYDTREEAQEALIKKLKKSISDFDLIDFGWDAPRIVYSYFDLVHNKPPQWGEYKWSDLIEWAEEKSISWWKEAPELLQIFEIEV